MKMALHISSVALCLLFIFFLRFQNPKLTETQLLIEFWEVWLLILIVIGLNILFFDHKSDNFKDI